MSNFAGTQTFQFSRADKFSKNRLVLAPLTHNMSADNGDLSDEEISWLKQCVDGGFGMVITAATMVNSQGRCWPGQPGLLNDKQLDKFAEIAQYCRENEALSIVQLHHGGVRSDTNLIDGTPFGPSDVAVSEQYPVGANGLSAKGISGFITDFVDAAIRAYQANMDGVELHAAHNFALSNFLNPLLNHREDAYGGTIIDRAKILVDIVKGIRAEVGNNFLLGVRLSPESYGAFDGITVADQIAVVKVLAQLPVDYIHWSLHDVFKNPDDLVHNEKKLLTILRQSVPENMPFLVAGKITDVADADKAIDLGADLVAVGRSAIGNPDWVNKINGGQKLLEPPFAAPTLQANGFNQAGIDYMSNFNGLVA